MEEEDRLVQECAAQGPRALCRAAATVPGSNPDAEGSLIGQQQWQAIHQRRAAGQNISAIARELDLDRKTVRGCLQQPSWMPYRREVVGPTLLDDEREFWIHAELGPVDEVVRLGARRLQRHLRITSQAHAKPFAEQRFAVPVDTALTHDAQRERPIGSAAGKQSHAKTRH